MGFANRLPVQSATLGVRAVLGRSGTSSCRRHHRGLRGFCWWHPHGESAAGAPQQRSASAITSEQHFSPLQCQTSKRVWTLMWADYHLCAKSHSSEVYAPVFNFLPFMRGRGGRCCSCYIPELWARNLFSLASSFNKSEENVSWENAWNKTKRCCWFSLLRKKIRSELRSPEGEMNWGEIFSWDLPVGILWWILSAPILSIFQNGLKWESRCCPWKGGEEKMD